MRLSVKELTLAFVIVAFLSPPANAGETATGVVERFQNSLISAMKVAARSTITERFAGLQSAVSESFHIPVMVRIAVGPHWDSASPNERERLVSAFRRVNIATLATFITGFNGKRFDRRDESAGPQGSRLVNTRLVKRDGSWVGLAYIARTYDGAWKLIDVIVDGGISELSVRRSEYQRILAEGGIAALIGALEAKADSLLGTRPATSS